MTKTLKNFLLSCFRVFSTVLLIILICKIFMHGLHSNDNFESNVHDDIAENRLKNHVRMLSQTIGIRNVDSYHDLIKSEKYIYNQFKEYGYDIEFQKFDADKKEVKNIIVIKKGLKEPDKIIIIGAHYDTFDNPGADDNASSIAGLLELANYFKNKDTNKTIKFIAFVNEEPPYFQTDLMGSYVYAKQAKKNNENIEACIILEMIGYYSNEKNSQRYPAALGLFYPNKGNFITFVGNISSFKLTNNVTKTFRKNTKFPSCKLIAPSFLTGVDYSDNWGFWKCGFPAIMVTDTSFYRNPNYHQYTDTYDTLNYQYLNEVINTLKKCVTNIVNKD